MGSPTALLRALEAKSGHTPATGGGAAKPKAPVRRQPSEAELAVRAQLAPLYQALDAAEKARSHQNSLDSYQAQQETLAYMRELAGQAPGAQADYTQAAQTTGQLAGNAAALLKGANPDPQIQAGLKAIGAPAAQQQQIGAQNQANFGGAAGALFTGQGSVPGSAIASQGLAAATFLRGLTGVTALAGQRAQAGRMQADQAARAKYQADRAGITAREPGLLQTYQAAQDANAYKQQQLEFEKATVMRQQGATEAQIQHQINQDRLAQARLGIYQQNADTASARARTAAANTQATAATKRGAARKTALANRSTAKTKGLTEARALADKGLAPKYRTVTKQVPIAGLTPAAAAAIPGGGGYRTVKTTKRVAAEPYATVRNRAISLPDVQILKTRYGYTDAQIEAFVDAQLAGAGYTVPTRKPTRPHRMPKSGQ